MGSEATADRGATAADTRELLLHAAAREIHVHGFQAASLNRILAETGVTKGALYYHFPGKQALGFAVLAEIFAPQLRAQWIAPLLKSEADGIDVLIDVIAQAGARLSARAVKLGCPVNNLAQEMSPVDARFRERIDAIFEEWRRAVAQMLQRAQAAGAVRSSVDVDSAAAFIVAALEGCVGVAKNAQSKRLLMRCGQGLIDYLRSLRVRPAGDHRDNG